MFCKAEPQRVVGARQGNPLVLGVGVNASAGETFLASDAMALAGTTDQIIYLEEGDVADIGLDHYAIVDGSGKPVVRELRTVSAYSGAVELGPYRHFMQKEIFEQPQAIADTLEGVAGIATGHVRRRGERHFCRSRCGAHLRLRHQLLLRPDRKVLARGHRRPADRKWRSPANTATAISVPNPRALVVVDLAVGRDRRYPGRAEARAVARAQRTRWRSATSPPAPWCARPRSSI